MRTLLTTLCLLLTLAACSSAPAPAAGPACDATTCEGCCREDGKCMAGTAAGVCGAAGAVAACAGASATGNAAELTDVTLEAGTHYLWVDGLGGTSGPFTLDVSAQ